MKLPVVALFVMGALALTACGSGRGRTVELPGGVLPSENANTPAPNAFDRMLGIDRRPNEGACPLMGVLYDSSRLVQFAQPNAQRYANIAFTGEMEGVHGLCRYVDADPITMSMDINMQFGRGPAATSDHRAYRYWVAVTRRGRAPIAKQYFDIDVAFPRNQAVVSRVEHINRIVIPRANADISGENFEILVGFELTPEQLQFNRDGRRFRIDAANAASPAPAPSQHN
ncbi:MAG: Tat pathway signal sequence domain protein [Proteobacteria bacterium]|nr:Tat pathway signal sequence domain protein [Pseudomonadota bacterium]